VRPLSPNSLDASTGLDLCAQIGAGPAVAHDFLVSDRHGGVVVGPLSLDGLGAGCW
jgi:hypothetical protein